ncbi:MAG: hypothetical protein MZV64_50065 [Ignavibacteriales bacterium]|nr:hypothetical protein [Ignavibacteriales bacterium]
MRGGTAKARIGLDDGDVALAEEGRQALARAGVEEVDGAEVALGLELLQVLEEERDLVVEAGHGLEGEGVGLAAGRGAELLEADGLLADAAGGARAGRRRRARGRRRRRRGGRRTGRASSLR